MQLEDLPMHLYEKFAELGQALSDATRLRIMNVLCQADRSVQQLADKLGHSAANTSAHLQVLHRARLVDKRKEGRKVYYGVAGEQALRLWLALRDTGLRELPEVREAMRRFASEEALLPDLSGEEILEKARRGEVQVLDLRTSQEYAQGHFPEARSIPYGELSERLQELDEGKEMVAYCRGPWCVAAIKGVRELREAGLDVRRIRGGVAEWRAEGLELEC